MSAGHSAGHHHLAGPRSISGDHVNASSLFLWSVTERRKDAPCYLVLYASRWMENTVSPLSILLYTRLFCVVLTLAPARMC
jgi:hypothetical protein